MGQRGGEAQDTKIKQTWVVFNIHKPYYTERVIATNSLWFLDFITSFIYSMINALVFSWMLIWIAVNLDCKKITAKNFIMRSKNYIKGRLLLSTSLTLFSFLNLKIKIKAIWKSYKYLSGILFVPQKINLHPIELKWKGSKQIGSCGKIRDEKLTGRK